MQGSSTLLWWLRMLCGPAWEVHGQHVGLVLAWAPEAWFNTALKCRAREPGAWKPCNYGAFGWVFWLFVVSKWLSNADPCMFNALTASGMLCFCELQWGCSCARAPSAAAA